MLCAMTKADLGQLSFAEWACDVIVIQAHQQAAACTDLLMVADSHSYNLRKRIYNNFTSCQACACTHF